MSAMSNSAAIRDIYVENDFFWSAYAQGLAFNDTSMDNNFGFNNGSMVYSIIDTGSSGLLMSSDYFSSIVTTLFETYIGNMNYVIKNGVVFSQCIDPNTLPPIFIMFNELWVQIRGADYMVDVSPNRDRTLCQLVIYKNPLAFNVLGTPMMIGYYTVHDTVNGKIGFVPS